jgi:hypothetical protein
MIMNGLPEGDCALKLTSYIKDDVFAAVRAGHPDTSKPMVALSLSRSRSRLRSRALALALALALTLARARARCSGGGEKEREIRDGCALCQFAVGVSLANQILIGGFVINAKRCPNADPKLNKDKDRATVLYLDPDHLLQPVHQARVPLNMLERNQFAKICQPVSNVNARWAT